MSWTTIRTGVKTRLDTISGINGSALAGLAKTDSISATVVPLDPLIVPNGHQGKTEIRFAVRVTVTKAKLEDSQTLLDGYIWPTGSSSVIAAIYGDPTLAAAVDDLQCVEVVGYSQVPDTQAVTADLNFRALVTA